MAEHKAQVILSNEVYKEIQWLTHNYDKEIGAVGVGKIRKNADNNETHFYIEKMYFPKQTTTTSTVHISQEGWGRIIQQVPSDRWGDVCFYWHKHPGNSPSHSGTDEEDTFETFMSPEANRPWFVFLQTAKGKGDSDLNIELRVEVRNPVRATLLGPSCTKLNFEISKGETKIKEKISKLQEKIEELRNKPNEKVKEKMESIIEEVVVKPTPVFYGNKGGGGWNNRHHKGYWNSNRVTPDKENSIIKELKLLFEVDKKKHEYIDNSNLMGLPTAEEEQAGLDIKNGCITIKAGSLFKIVIDNHLKPKGKLNELVHRVTVNPPSKGQTMHEYILQPRKKAYQELVQMSKRLFISYNDAILGVWQSKGIYKPVIKKGPGNVTKQIEHTKQNKEVSLKLTDTTLFNDLLFEFEFSGELKWEGTAYAKFIDKGTNKILGSVIKGDNMMIISGPDLVYLAKRIIYDLENQKKGDDKLGKQTKAKTKVQRAG